MTRRHDETGLEDWQVREKRMWENVQTTEGGRRFVAAHKAAKVAANRAYILHREAGLDDAAAHAATVRDLDLAPNATIEAFDADFGDVAELRLLNWD